MQFTLENDGSVNLVRGYTHGCVTINEADYTQSVVLMPDRIISNWAPAGVGELSAAHLADVLDLEPEIILIGTGERLEFPERGLLAIALERGIGIECMDTSAACRTYNILVHEGRRVAAVLLIDAPRPAAG
ncbi:Mth938-like domain-containing protein [soil metagenome]